jgi:hypothetical protein
MADKESTVDKANKLFTKGCGMYSFFTRLILCIVFTCILTCIGVFIYQSSNDYKGRTMAKINKATCDSVVVRDGSRTKRNYNCELNLSYKVKDKEYTQDLTSSSSKFYREGTDVEIDYNTLNPELIKIHEFGQNKLMGIGSITVAGLCLLSSIIHTALYFTSEWYEHSLCADLLSPRYNSYGYNYGRSSLISIF